MDRRDFIKTSAGAFFIAAAGRAIGAGAPSNRVRFAMMGCHKDGRGFHVMQRAAEVPGAEIAVVVDVDARARKDSVDKIAALTGVRPEAAVDIRQVLKRKDIDGIICCTPDHWHAPAAWMAMNAGKAVYVEKPCSFCPREGEILLETQKRTGMVFQMGMQRRASDVYRTAIDEIRNGLIGEPTWAKCWYETCRVGIGKGRPAPVPSWLNWDLWQGPAPRREFHDNIVPYKWHWFRHWGTGEAGNNATHFVDIARWAMGLDVPERVTCGGGRFFVPQDDDWEWPDTMDVSYVFPNRKFVTWGGASCTRTAIFADCGCGCMVYGTKGSMLFGPNDTAAYYETAKITPTKEWKNDKLTAIVGSLTNPVQQLDVKHMTNFVEAIRKHDANTYAPVDESVKSTLLVHLANIALDAGGSIELDPNTARLKPGSKGADRWARTYEKGWEMV